MLSKTESNIIDQATIDFYVAKGRQERSQAVVAFIRSLFAKSETAPVEAKSACAA